MKKFKFSKTYWVGKFIFTGQILLIWFLTVLISNSSKVESKQRFISHSIANVKLNPFYFDEKPKLTKEKYNKLKIDMSYKQVVDIIGIEGKETLRAKIKGSKITTYKWQGEDFTFIFCNFKDNKLTSKTQANLN